MASVSLLTLVLIVSTSSLVYAATKCYDDLCGSLKRWECDYTAVYTRRRPLKPYKCRGRLISMTEMENNEDFGYDLEDIMEDPNFTKDNSRIATYSRLNVRFGENFSLLRKSSSAAGNSLRMSYFFLNGCNQYYLVKMGSIMSDMNEVSSIREYHSYCLDEQLDYCKGVYEQIVWVPLNIIGHRTLAAVNQLFESIPRDTMTSIIKSQMLDVSHFKDIVLYMRMYLLTLDHPNIVDGKILDQSSEMIEEEILRPCELISELVEGLSKFRDGFLTVSPPKPAHSITEPESIWDRIDFCRILVEPLTKFSIKLAIDEG